MLIRATAEPGAVMPNTASVVTDVTWAVVRPEDAVEHISTRLGRDSITIGIFINGQVDCETGLTALALFNRVQDMSPLLRGWTVTSFVRVRPADCATASIDASD